MELLLQRTPPDQAPLCFLAKDSFIHSSIQGSCSPWQVVIIGWAPETRVERDQAGSWRELLVEGRWWSKWVMAVPSDDCMGAQWREQHPTVGWSGRASWRW